MASEPMTETELKQFVYRALVGYRERDFSEMGNTDIHVVTESLVDNIVTEARATLAAREGDVLAVDHKNVGVRIESDWHGNFAAHTFARLTGVGIAQGPWCSTADDALRAIGIRSPAPSGAGTAAVTDAMVAAAYKAMQPLVMSRALDYHVVQVGLTAALAASARGQK